MAGPARRATRASAPNRGANAIYDLSADNQLTFKSYYKIARHQNDTENCVAHNGSIIPVDGRDVMVQSWYQGGVSLWEFTDSGNPKELDYFERGPLVPTALGGTWSAYYYNGFVYSSDIQKGFDVLMLKDPTLRKAELGPAQPVQRAVAAGLPDPLTHDRAARPDTRTTNGPPPPGRAVPCRVRCGGRPRLRASGAGDGDRVAGADASGHDDPGVEAAQAQRAARRAPLTNRIASAPKRSTNFAHPVCGWSVTSMTAPRMRRVADRQPGARGQVVVGQVQVEVELVSGERAASGVAGEEGDERRAHDVELHVGVRTAVGGAAAGPLGPGVADEADLEVELALGELLALPRRRAAHDELEGAGIPGRGEQLGRKAASSSGVRWVAERRSVLAEGGCRRREVGGRASPAVVMAASVTARRPCATPGFHGSGGAADAVVSRAGGSGRPDRLEEPVLDERRDAAVDLGRVLAGGVEHRAAHRAVGVAQRLEQRRRAPAGRCRATPGPGAVARRGRGGPQRPRRTGPRPGTPRTAVRGRGRRARRAP